MAAKLEGNRLCEGECGTDEYVAPEVLKEEKYDFKADVWCVGAVAKFLLGGSYHPSKRQKDEAQSFIQALLEEDPTRRPTAKEALQHGYLTLQ